MTPDFHQHDSWLDSISAEFWLLDCDGRIVRTNSFVNTLYRLPPEQIAGKHRGDVKPGLDSPDDDLAETLRVAQTGMPVWRSNEHFCLQGEDRWTCVDKFPLVTEGGQIRNVVVFGYDITAQMNAEREFRKLRAELEHRVAERTDELGAANTALRTSEERTHAILERALDAVISIDRNGIVTAWNAAAVRILGWSASEVIGRELAELIIPQEFRAMHRMGLLRARDTGSGPVIGKIIEVQALRRDGTRFPIELGINAVGRGDSIFFTAFVRDISERKATEDKLYELNLQLERRIEEAGSANRELEAFCYSVSHDLRTPLRSIDGFSQALMEDCGGMLDNTGLDYMRRVRSATQRMARLIDDLLNLSRVSRAEMRREPLDLALIARGITAELREAEPARKVEFTTHPDLSVDGDPALVRIALQNLLGNAWKYTRHTENARVELGVEDKHGRRIFFVRDNGAGFDMAYSDKLFVPFQRLHRPDEFEGTGIGLATVLRILHRHGGHAWAEGTVGAGATVYFTL